MKHRNKHLFFIGYFFYILILSSSSFSAVDLEDLLINDLIIETRKIDIPNYSYAFNPSLVRWNNSLLMSFRVIPNIQDVFNSLLYVIWLDENFIPKSKAYHVQTREFSYIPSRLEDGRLICVGQRLYLAYSDNKDIVITKDGFRMHITELHFDGNDFYTENTECFSSFEGNNKYRREKNWTPFDYHGELMFSYSIQPHKIFYPLLGGSGYCETFALTEMGITWNWGELRGGTPALLDGNHYLAFFHSSKQLSTIQSYQEKLIHYFIGAYTFSSKPPFEILQISKQPIIDKTFYNGIEYEPYWKPVKVVFPCGFIFDQEYIWLAYGRQDHEVWLAKVDKKKLYESLVNVFYQ